MPEHDRALQFGLVDQAMIEPLAKGKGKEIGFMPTRTPATSVMALNGPG